MNIQRISNWWLAKSTINELEYRVARYKINKKEYIIVVHSLYCWIYTVTTGQKNLVLTEKLE